jgi:glycosyltransferase involved in cell wall biosynthesis
MYKNKKIGVVVPALNEERFIATVIQGIPEYVDCIYVIDDGSTDDTFKIASVLASGNPSRIKVIKNERNLGVGRSVTTGYQHCLSDDVDIAVVMAGDNQMDATRLPLLLDPIVEEKADYSAGDRLSHKKHVRGMSAWRYVGNMILTWLTRIAAWNFSICDPQNGYNAISSKMLTLINLDSIYPRYGYLNNMLVKLTINRARIIYIPMPSNYGNEKSKIKYWHYIPTVSWLLLKDFIWRIKVRLINHRSKIQ